MDDLAERRPTFGSRPGSADEAVERREDHSSPTSTVRHDRAPKACMITHRNYYAMVAVVDRSRTSSGPRT